MRQRLYIILIFALSTNILLAQDTSGSYEYEGRQREYIFHEPIGFDNTDTPRPLVLALHGLGDVITNFSNIGLSTVADTANFYVVYPQAITSFLGTAWNNGATALGISLNDDVDDVGFLNSLIDSLAANYPIDLNRVYCTGFSMGSIMSNRMACQLSDRLAAVAGVAGPISDIDYAACNAARPMPILHIHGTADGTVSYENGNFNVNLEAGLTSAVESVNFWANFNNCSDASILEELPDIANDGMTVEKQTFSPCDEGAEVILYTINNGPHSWLQATNDINASVEIWNFFNRFQLDGDVSIEKPTYTQNIDIQVFPNPTSRMVTIQSEQANISQVRLVNVFGQVLHQASFSNPQHRIEQDLTQIPSGNYFLQVFFKEGFITKKITKE